MATSRRRRRGGGVTPSAPSSEQPTFGWVRQPAPPSIEEAARTYARFGVTRGLLEARERLHAYMRSPETIERAAFERRAGRVGPESLVGSYIGPRVKAGRLTDEMCVVGLVRRKERDRARICESCRLHDLQDRIR